jgi:hypothetical protein
VHLLGSWHYQAFAKITVGRLALTFSSLVLGGCELPQGRGRKVVLLRTNSVSLVEYGKTGPTREDPYETSGRAVGKTTLAIPVIRG